VELSRVSAFGNLEGSDARSSGAEGFGAPADASIDTGPRVRRERAPAKPSKPVPWLQILVGTLAVLVVGGVGTTFTRLGPFGYYYVTDAMHAAEYAKLATSGIQSMHDAFATEMFADAKGVADKLAAQRAAKPRARSLTAVAAIAELETELRFGKDPDRANRAKIWLTTEIPEPRSPDRVKYLDVALAAASALDREKDKARSGFDAAARKYGGDPIQQDIAFLRGELELRSGDGVAAAAAFKKALELAPGARAHFGLARAAYLAGDLKTAWSELGATIAASPKHGAALLLRAEIAWARGRDDAAARAALQDISTLLDGPARGSISTTDQAEAYAERGVIQFARGRVGEARQAFDDALKVDQRNVSALIGQGDVLYEEGRTTEALSRYDTAKQADSNSVPAIVGDAKTQIQLERLADAKTQLAAAVQKFPKSPLARQWYAIAEAALGDKKNAEKDFLAAIDLVDPKDPDAITPYAAYASFLNAQGRTDEAKAKLAEAQQKLPDSIALERTLGDVGITQGNFTDAVAHFRAAVAMDGEDVSSRFKLGRALRLANQLDEAAKVFDTVYAADKSFPGLSLERGQLFEQSGDVQKALEQFKTALDAHPNDPDLMLRVGASYVAIGQGEKAEPLLREVLKQRPNSAEAEHYLGRALMLQGPLHQQEAMRHLQTAVGRDSNRAEFHLYVGWLANAMVPIDLNLAQKEVDRALELDQTLADAYWQKGVYEYFGGKLESSLKDLQHALQLKPTRFEAHATLAQVYDQKNMTDAAISEWRLALAHKDDDELWNYKLGLLLMDRGSASEAAARLKAATEAGEQDQPRPMWLQGAEYPCAEALQRVGDVKGACDHYTKFLEQADQNNPDRVDALHKCLATCGHACTP
jgi:tetratricopeptide (TPR) repeat protein